MLHESNAVESLLNDRTCEDSRISLLHKHWLWGSDIMDRGNIHYKQEVQSSGRSCDIPSFYWPGSFRIGTPFNDTTVCPILNAAEESMSGGTHPPVPHPDGPPAGGSHLLDPSVSEEPQDDATSVDTAPGYR